ncbi:hypothetical protein WA026_007833 [Henosepilachna vigintioctopunctata]|uniref:Uncharacterized protein n=1 Tax=Henosepilachna vigintioctopunctata TaxID=420089 RepID=A0AAW1TYU0_9CUCU
MKRTILYALLILFSVSYVITLECYVCTSTEPCKDPATVNCDEDNAYCVSLKYDDTYGKGCETDPKFCDNTDNEGNTYSDCSLCQTDLCNK